MIDPSVLGLMTGGGSHIGVDQATGHAGPSNSSPINGVGGSIQAGVSTNAGGSLVGGVTLLMAAIILVVYLKTKGRQQ